MSGMKKGSNSAHPHQQQPRRKKGGDSFGNNKGTQGEQFGKRQKPDSSTKHSNPKNSAGAEMSASPAASRPQNKAGAAGEGHSEMAERLDYITLNLVGQRVQVQVKDGSIYEGVFHSGHTDRAGFEVILKMAKKQDQSPEAILKHPVESMTISAQDFVQVIAPEVSFVEDVGKWKKRGGAGFATDSEISQEGYRMRELTPWTPDPGQDLSLADELESSGVSWDQFATNQKLFGVQSTYDEEIYTTPLDRSSTFYRQHHQKAQRLAVEITKKTAANPHLAEERGQVVGTDFEDEEDRYSTVIRDQPANNHGQAAAGRRADKPGEAGAAPGTYQIPAKRARGQKPSGPTTPKSPRGTTPETGNGEASENQPTHPSEKTDSSPPVPKLETNPLLARQSIGLRPRSFSAGNIGEVLAARNANKDLYAERLRIQKILEDKKEPSMKEAQLRERGEKKNPRGSSPQSPLLSPLVGHPEGIAALNLLPATPVIDESVQKQFNEFKMEKQKKVSSEFMASIRDQKLLELRSFSREIDRRASAPNSPIARRRHTIISATNSYRAELQKQQEEGSTTTTTSTTSTTSTTVTQVTETVSAVAIAPKEPVTTTTTSTPATEATTPATAESSKTDKKEEETPVAPPAKSLSKLNPFAKAFTPKVTPKLQELPPPPVPEVYMEPPMEGMPYEMYDARFDPGAEMMGYPPYGGVYYMEEDPMHFNPSMGPPRGPVPYGVPMPYISSPSPQQLPSPPVNMFPPQPGYGMPPQGPQVGFGGFPPGSGPAPPFGGQPHMYPQGGKRMPPPPMGGYPPQGYPAPPPQGFPLSPPPLRHHPLTPPSSGGVPLSTSPPMLNPTSPPASPSMHPQGPFGPPTTPPKGFVPMYDTSPPPQGVYGMDPQGPPPQGRGGYQGQQSHFPPPTRYGGGGGRGGPSPAEHGGQFHGGNRQQPYYGKPPTEGAPQTHIK